MEKRYQEELAILKRQFKALKIIFISSLLCGASVLLFICATPSKDILRVRGIIIEDANGRASIMMGDPIPRDKSRVRKDLQGIVLIDTNGSDRLYLGRTGAVQTGGKSYKRLNDGWAFVVNDPNGDERGGFGFKDEEDAIGLGLDYGGKDGLEAIYLHASAQNAYLKIDGNVNKGFRDRIVLYRDNNKDLSQIKIGDSSRDDRIMLRTLGGDSDGYYRDRKKSKDKIHFLKAKGVY